jgi:hypothetical protein
MIFGEIDMFFPRGLAERAVISELLSGKNPSQQVKIQGRLQPR